MGKLFNLLLTCLIVFINKILSKWLLFSWSTSTFFCLGFTCLSCFSLHQSFVCILFFSLNTKLSTTVIIYVSVGNGYQSTILVIKCNIVLGLHFMQEFQCNNIYITVTAVNYIHDLHSVPRKWKLDRQMGYSIHTCTYSWKNGEQKKQNLSTPNPKKVSISLFAHFVLKIINNDYYIYKYNLLKPWMDTISPSQRVCLNWRQTLDPGLGIASLTTSFFSVQTSTSSGFSGSPPCRLQATTAKFADILTSYSKNTETFLQNVKGRKLHTKEEYLYPGTYILWRTCCHWMMSKLQDYQDAVTMDYILVKTVYY